MTLEWTEHLDSRQATRKDLGDIARALGVDVSPRTSVLTLRRLIRAELEKLAAVRELAKQDEQADRKRVQDEQFESVFGQKPPEEPSDLSVERDDDGLYVEIAGTRYRGEDLPDEGTWVLQHSTYTAIPNHQEAEIEWSGATPSGRCRATLRGD